mgnify:CR=1 FL=1
MKRRRITGELAALAWRNVWRNRRRTTLNVMALSVGMGILVVSLGWIGGYHTYIYDTLKDFQTGELQVMNREWYAERTRLPVDLLVNDYESVRQSIAAVDGVRTAVDGTAAVTGRVEFSARISTGRRSWRSAVTAIDPRFEPSVGVLGRYVTDGRRPADLAGTDDRGIWIGRPLAEKAGVSVGDSLFLRAVNRHGVENLYDARVVGIFEYGYPALDEQMIYVDLSTATELLDLDGAVTHVVVRLDDGTSVTTGLERVRGAVASTADAGTLEVRPWQDFARTAVSAVESDTHSFILMMIVMYLLIVLGILNSMSMSVHERTREIGTIRAIGMRGRSLLAMFALESVWQAAIATVVALVVTVPIALWLALGGVDIASSMPDTMPIPFGERFRADFAVWHYLFTAASGLLTALLGAIIPARRAAKLTVAEAMRSVG